LKTGESSYSGNTGTHLSVPLGYQVAYPHKPFCGWVGEFRHPHPFVPAAFVLCFLPFGEREQSCKARSCHWELGRVKDKCTAGIHRAGCVQTRWPGVTLSKAQGLTIRYGLGLQWNCHDVVGLPLLLYSLLVCMRKAGSHAKEKEQLPFSATEGHVDCPAVDKLNFQRRGQ